MGFIIEIIRQKPHRGAIMERIQKSKRRCLSATALALAVIVFAPIQGLTQPDEASQAEEEQAAAQGFGAILADTLKGLIGEGNIFTPNGASARPVEGGDEGEPEKFNLNFNNAPIEQVLKFLSDLTNKVVLKADDVQGQFNIINPNEVTREQALEIIDQAFLLKQITTIETDQMIVVMTVAAAKQKGLQIEADGDEEMGSRMVHSVIKLQYASPQALKDALTPLLPDTANVIADERTRSLIITDTSANIQRLRSIITELDTESAIGDMAVEVFRLKYLNANDIGRDLDDLLGNIVQSQMSDTGGRRQQAPVELVIDRQTNSIVVSAPKEAIDDVREFIANLDVPQTDSLQTQNFTLKNGDAAEVAETVQQLAQARRTSTYQPIISADSRTNTIIISAYPEDVLEFAKLIKVLDEKESYEKDTRIYRLDNADAIILKPMLEQLLNNQQQSSSGGRNYYYYFGGSSDQQSISIIEDQRQNALVVTAKPGEFPMIEKMIEQLDQPLPESAEEPRIYQVKYVNAADLAYLINTLFEQTTSTSFSPYLWDSGSQSNDITGLTGKVKVVADQSTNSLIVIAATPRAFLIIEGLIEKLDRTSPEFGGTRVVPLKNASAVELAEQLNELFQEDQQNRGNQGFFWYQNQSSGDTQDNQISNLIGNVRIVSETRTNSLLISTNSQYFESVESIITELDREIGQVLIEILIVEIIDLSDNELGINWPDNIPVQTTLQFDGAFDSFNLDRTTILTRSSFETVIGALARSEKTNVLARPDVLTGDNQSAYVEVVDRIPVVGQISQGNVTTNQQVEYVDVGLLLTVQPRINDEDTVTINVSLETGQVLESFGLKVGDSTIPAFNRRRVTTELMIDDEETAVLSGVIDTSYTNVDDGIPGLRDIPILGYLFKSNSRRRSNKELMAFITPYILHTVKDRERAFRRHRERIQNYDQFEEHMDDLNVNFGVKEQ